MFDDLTHNLDHTALKATLPELEKVKAFINARLAEYDPAHAERYR